MYRNCMKGQNCSACNCKKQTDSMLDDVWKNTMNMYNECECGFDEEINKFPTNPMYAQSYVPWQIIDKTYIPSVGLKMGTIFPELVSPYMPGQSMEEINYIKNSNNIGEECNSK